MSILPLVFFILLRVRFPLAVFLSALNVAVFTAYWSVVLCNNESECKMDAQIFSQARYLVTTHPRRSSRRWLYLPCYSTLLWLYLPWQVVSVTSLIALVSGYGGYMRERALRRDFLLQQQVNPSPSPNRT